MRGRLDNRSRWWCDTHLSGVFAHLRSEEGTSNTCAPSSGGAQTQDTHDPTQNTGTLGELKDFTSSTSGVTASRQSPAKRHPRAYSAHSVRTRCTRCVLGHSVLTRRELRAYSRQPRRNRCALRLWVPESRGLDLKGFLLSLSPYLEIVSNCPALCQIIVDGFAFDEFQGFRGVFWNCDGISCQLCWPFGVFSSIVIEQRDLFCA